MAYKYDAIVIGTGQSGPSLAGYLAGKGMKVAIAERKRFGGTCVNTGCIPTKTLVASARAAHMAKRGQDFGVMIDGPVKVDMKRVKARKDYVVSQSRDPLEKWLKGMDNTTVYEGHARFEGPHTIRVAGELLEADRIFINVGARAAEPPIPGLQKIEYLTNSDMMEIDFLPEHLVIIGGSYVGLEFGQMYRRFGSEVTILQRGPRLLSREDEDISETIKTILEEEGVNVIVDARNIQVEKRDGELVVNISGDGNLREVVGSHLLIATGRIPNTSDLGLDRAGIEMDRKGYIKVDEQLSTNIVGVWAMGDCNGQGAFTHTSYNDYEIVKANLEGESRSLKDRIFAYALYIDPPLGRAGLTATQARASGRKVLIARRPMSRVGRAFEKGETQGFMKFLVDAENKQILGAAILGVEGDEVIHSVLDVMYAKAPYTVIQRAMHIHPTVSELIPTALENLEPLK